MARRMFRLISRKIRATFISIHWNVCKTIAQYEDTTDYLADFLGGELIPDSSTIRHHMMPYLIEKTLVNSFVYECSVTKDGYMTGNSARKKKSVVFFPSPWAVMDVCKVRLSYEIFFNPNACWFIGHRGINNSACIERSRIFWDPGEMLERSISFWVDGEGYPVHAEIGDVLSL